MRPLVRGCLALAILTLPVARASAVNIDWVPVGNPSNPADTPASNCISANCGSVPYEYLIGKYEVTNAQYAEFLNAKAASDPLGLYFPFMATQGGITRTGASGSFTYNVKSGFANKPVVYVSFYDAMRFTNWLHNGQGAGDTETGAYTLLGGTPTPSNGTTVPRNPGANIFLPSESEWYKAAYYDGLVGVYYDYPAGTNTQTVCAAPTGTANRANCANAAGGGVTDVGSYTGSASPYGTFDQGGNLYEWNEAIWFGSERSTRGGDAGGPPGALAASLWLPEGPGVECICLGFRVASLVPEPGTALMLGGGLLGLAARRRRE